MSIVDIAPVVRGAYLAKYGVPLILSPLAEVPTQSASSLSTSRRAAPRDSSI